MIEGWSLTTAPTPGELLWTWRKRNKFSVIFAAQTLQTTRLSYVKAEHDRISPLEHQPIVVPSQAELLRILRRRSYVGRDDVALRLGVSHVTYLDLERRADARVVHFWLEESLITLKISEVTADT